MHKHLLKSAQFQKIYVKFEKVAQMCNYTQNCSYF